MTTKTRKPLSIRGFGAAACIACCIGPIVAFLGATGLFTAAGTALFGVTGLVLLVPAAVIWHRRRRRRSTACTSLDDRPIPVTVGRRRDATTACAVPEEPVGDDEPAMKPSGRTPCAAAAPGWPTPGSWATTRR